MQFVDVESPGDLVRVRSSDTSDFGMQLRSLENNVCSAVASRHFPGEIEVSVATDVDPAEDRFARAQNSAERLAGKLSERPFSGTLLMMTIQIDSVLTAERKRIDQEKR